MRTKNWQKKTAKLKKLKIQHSRKSSKARKNNIAYHQGKVFEKFKEKRNFSDGKTVWSQ